MGNTRNIIVQREWPNEPCPFFLMQFVETDLGVVVGKKVTALLGGYVPMEMVIKGVVSTSYEVPAVNFVIHVH